MTAGRPRTDVYAPRGAALRLLKDKSPEILLSGPAGTGKSRGCLEKMNALAIKYPNSRHLIVRKTRESLSETGLVTFEERVRPWCDTMNMQRRIRQAYHYPNGSEIVVGGMDKPTKVMSSEYDTIYVQEATELTVTDWENLTTRLRNGAMPYQQLYADANPDRPTHWLKRRADAGTVRLIECRHEDNPRLWDASANAWTTEGEAYIARLERLTGVRYQRLRKGLWVAADGLVYDDWDPAVHLVTLEDLGLSGIPRDWRRFRAVDFGFTNPFCCQWWAVDPDGRLYLYREIYRTQRLVEDHARRILELEAQAGGERIESTVCDHDAEDRATLERHLGCPTVGADKSVSPGIQAVQTRLRKAADGRPRLYVLRDALVERDEALAEAGRPTCTAEEVEGYVWAPADNGKREAPVKHNDHGQDTTRYAVMHEDLAPPAATATDTLAALRAAARRR